MTNISKSVNSVTIWPSQENHIGQNLNESINPLWPT